MSTAALEEPTEKLRFCVVGELAVGKTCLVRRFVFDQFEDRYLATLGTKVTKRELQVKMPGSGKPLNVILTIWDIMGEKGFRELLREAYFLGAQGILAVCDVTRPETLGELKGWRNSIQKVAGEGPTYVLANKVDLVEEARFGEADLKAFCEGFACPYLFTSAKTGAAVKEAFRELTKLVVEEQLQRAKVIAH